MKKALFFDLDGTLWDALIPLTASWNDAMKKENLPFRFDLAKMKSYMGLTPEETVPLAFPGVSMEEGMEYFKIAVTAEIRYLASHPGTLYPKEKEILGELSSRYPLYIVSNSDKGYVENYLRACGTEKYFTGHLCAGDTGLAKWQNILYLKEKEKVDSLVYIGDTDKDRVESKKAGVPFIHAAYGFGKIDPDPCKIDSLPELVPLAEKLLGGFSS